MRYWTIRSVPIPPVAGLFHPAVLTRSVHMHQFNHPAGDAPVVEVRHLCKTSVLHQQGGIRIQALQDVNFDVRAGECVALHGPSGAGKSDPAQDPVRVGLSAQFRAGDRPLRRLRDGYGHGLHACHQPCTPGMHRLCQPVPPCHSACECPGFGGRTSAGRR